MYAKWRSYYVVFVEVPDAQASIRNKSTKPLIVRDTFARLHDGNRRTCTARDKRIKVYYTQRTTREQYYYYVRLSLSDVKTRDRLLHYYTVVRVLRLNVAYSFRW